MIERYAALDYDALKLSLRELRIGNREVYLEFLNHPTIKKKLINSTPKYNFIWFVQEEADDTILTLLSDSGMDILSHSSFLVDRLNGLLTCGKDYVNRLFLDDRFCQLVLDHERDLSSYFSSLQAPGALAFVKYMERVNTPLEDIPYFLVRLSAKTMKEVVEKHIFPMPVVEEILTNGSKEAEEYLLSHDVRITTLANYSFSKIYRMAQAGTHIPSSLIHEKKFFHKITHLWSVKDYRFLVNELGYANDVSTLEETRKKYYDQMIDSFIEEENMLPFHFEMYQKIKMALEGDPKEKERRLSTLLEKLEPYFLPYGTNRREYEMRVKICELYQEGDLSKIHQYLEEESNLLLSDMIIDRHFEELPYNFFLDVQQLCHFQMEEGRTLSDEDLKQYEQLLEIDSLPYPEKKRLHETLKKTNFVEKYYDDFRMAKDGAAELIKEKMLTKKSSQPWKDEELSKRAGVDVFVLEGAPFYAFVKSLSIPKKRVLTERDVFYSVDAGSYSLDGSSKLHTFNNPREYYNIAYDDFATNQVMHVYPVDSFSKYVREGKGTATKRVYQLMTPEELVQTSYHYNEIVYLQRNDGRKDELNQQLQVPSMFAIYCYDQITDEDVMSARNLGLSIILVKTKSYTHKTENRISMHDTILHTDGYQQGINYITDISEDEQYGRRK